MLGFAVPAWLCARLVRPVTATQDPAISYQKPRPCMARRQPILGETEGYTSAGQGYDRGGVNVYEALIGIAFLVLVIYLGIKSGYGEDRDTDSDSNEGQ